MTRMHNPPHPGEILREYLGDITVTEAAVKLGVNRVTLSRVVTGASGFLLTWPIAWVRLSVPVLSCGQVCNCSTTCTKQAS